jgi:nitrite reductase/ring-hydroxylating ferredoxin subunit
LITGLAAAIPGLIDFLYTVPPDSSAKTRAGTHGLLNVCMLVLFTLALLFRKPEHGAITLVFEAGGFGVMLVAGWMGGTLVHRNQIGIDSRYAFAGKWKEEFVEEKNGMVQLGDGSDLKRDQMKLVHIGNKRIVLARGKTGFVAFSDHCTHRGGSLAGGTMMCDTVQCPWHGSQFDVLSGEIKAGPAQKKIVTYPVQIVGGKIQVRIA